MRGKGRSKGVKMVRKMRERIRSNCLLGRNYGEKGPKEGFLGFSTKMNDKTSSLSLLVIVHR